MDLVQLFISVTGYFFFAAWSMVLAAVSFIAFGRDLLPARPRAESQKEHLQAGEYGD